MSGLGEAAVGPDSPGRASVRRAKSQVGPPAAPAEDLRLVAGLRRRDEKAFCELVDLYHSSLIRLAMVYMPSRAVAEEIVQETWLGVLQGVDRFEGRSSLKTWIYRILVNRAKTRSEREGRSIPFSQFFDADNDPGESSLGPERFLPADHEQWPGHWAVPPQRWGDDPETILLSNETQDFLRKTISELPPSQREVITLRDIQQWDSAEVCNALGISETNQRVLLHRARARVRRALEERFGKVQSR